MDVPKLVAAVAHVKKSTNHRVGVRVRDFLSLLIGIKGIAREEKDVSFFFLFFFKKKIGMVDFWLVFVHKR